MFLLSSEVFGNSFLWCEMTLHSAVKNKESGRSYLDYIFKSYEIKKDDQQNFNGMEVNFYKLDEESIIENVNHFTISGGPDDNENSNIYADNNWYSLLDRNLNQYEKYGVFRYRQDKIGMERFKNFIDQQKDFPDKEFLTNSSVFFPEYYVTFAADHNGNYNWFSCSSISNGDLNWKVDDFQQIQNKYNEKIKLEIKTAEDNKL